MTAGWSRTRPITSTLLSSLLALSAVLSATASRAADAPPVPPASGTRLEIGAEERIRTENWDNVADFNERTIASGDVRHQVRFRARIWEKLNVGPKTEVMLQFANETFRKTTPAARFKWDETVVENLYLDYRFSDRLSARLGRQNLAHGDGFLLSDGTPLDGSRTVYMNALDLGWSFGKSKLELMAISDPDRDIYIPPINDRKKTLVEGDELALGLYFTDSRLPKTPLEVYYFFKTETGDTRAATNPAFQPDRRLHTLGGRLARQFDGGWSASSEVAGQAGTQDPGVDILAWAACASVKKAFTHASKPSLSLGYIGLSGDDPATAKIEGWDPLFSRWSKWSELYLYGLVTEKGPAYWSNFSMGQAELAIAPVRRLNLRATYYRVGAFHRSPGKPEIFAGGATRGDLYQVRADVKVNDSVRGHIVGEWLEPGSFYTGPDGAWFFRAEVIYSIRKTLAL
jgi:hypothetical protein